MKAALVVRSCLSGVLSLYLTLAGLATVAAGDTYREFGNHLYINASVAPQGGPGINITDIQASHNAVTQGQIVNIGVTVENLEETAETFEVVLRDNADGREIGSVILTLEGVQGMTVGFQWDTTPVPSGAYHPTASATAPGRRDTLYSSLSSPLPVTVEPAGIVFDSLEPPGATFGHGMARLEMATQPHSLEQIFLGGRHPRRAGELLRPDVTTTGTLANSIFVSNAGATFQPAAAMRNPFLEGALEGTLRLQGRASSLGAYVRAGSDIFFVDPEGGYRITAPGGVHDVLLEAPGYVPVRIRNAALGSGEVLVLPEVTLPFGDANGDGKIDILDLSIAAGNFGETLVEMEAP